MGSAPKPPPAPDPVATANAQTNMNVDSAVATNMNNMTNQVTPEGSLTYNQTGSRTYTGADGKVYNIPSFTATQTLSPQEQALFNTNNATQKEIASIGQQQAGRIGNLLSTPLNLSDTSIDQDLYNLYSPRVQLQQQNTLNSLNAQMAAQGITQGSQAYNNAMTLNSQANNDQWNQLYLNGRNSAMQQMTMQRQEPINEIDALMSGSQVTNPTFGQTPSSTINPANYEQDVQNTYQDQMAGYNAQLQQNNAMMGGIFGSLGTLGGAFMMSDRRVKRAIVLLGELPNGLPVYSYEYAADGRPDIGLMAQDVELVKPWAVREFNGVLHIDYKEAVL